MITSFLKEVNINQIKLEVHDTCKEDEKTTTDFETFNNEDVINKSYLDEIFFYINGHLSILEKDYNEFQLQYNKQLVEEVLFQRAVKTTIQIPYDEEIFDNYAKADKILRKFLSVTRRRGDLEEVKHDDVQ